MKHGYMSMGRGTDKGMCMDMDMTVDTCMDTGTGMDIGKGLVAKTDETKSTLTYIFKK